MKTQLRPFKVLGSGKYMPRERVSSEELDRRIERPKGWSEDRSQVKSRYFVNREESPSFLAAQAVRAACVQAGCQPESLDLLISASFSRDQPIPHQASAVHRALGLEDSGIPCMDIDTTCLSFVTALDVASLYLDAGIHRRIAIVSAETPSVGLNWKDANTASLFGDGAAAFILESSSSGESGILASLQRTYSSGYENCQMKAGAVNWNMRRPPASDDDYCFSMQGKQAFKLVAEKIQGFIGEFEEKSGIRMKDVDLVVPHQASPLGLAHVQKILEIPDSKIVNILADHGNQVAASIPIAWHYARESGRAKPGSLVLLMGTSAGQSIGAALVRMG